MARQSLYRRYRPRRFAEVRGQDQLTEALRRSVAEDRVGHSYLFSGPRGTGKTTTARILAKALNCEQVVDGEPCAECESCRSIADGNSFDVMELDAASHNGVDEIRDLIDHASQSTPGRHRVYILDEVHMLSKSAANALLKTLEEPPEHVVFILATTDPQKLLPTIRSRTQHFEVHLLDTTELTELVDEVVTDAGLDVDADIRRWAVRTGAGSARDTLSALERAVALGAIPDATTSVDDIVNAIAEADTAAALAAVDANVRAGRSPVTIGDDLIAHLRLVFLTVMGAPAIGEAPDVLERVAEQASRLGARGTTHALEVLGEALASITRVPDPRVPLELAMVRLTQPELDSSPSALLARIERLERALAGGDVAPLTTPAAPPPPPPPPPPASAPGASPAPAATPTPATATLAEAAEVVDDSVHPPDAVPAGTGAADAARQALASRRKGESGAVRRPAAPPAAPATPPPAPAAEMPADDTPVTDGVDGGEPTDDAPTAPTPEPPDSATPAAEPPATSSPTAPSAGDGPSLPVGVVAEAWQRSVTNAADQKVRARLGPARVVAVEGSTVIVTLPNERAVQRGSELREAARDALAADLGRSVELEIRVGSGSAPAQDRVAPPPTPAELAEPDEDVGDVTGLLDADIAPTDDLARVAEVFPGAEVVETTPEPTP